MDEIDSVIRIEGYSWSMVISLPDFIDNGKHYKLLLDTISQDILHSQAIYEQIIRFIESNEDIIKKVSASFEKKAQKLLNMTKKRIK